MKDSNRLNKQTQIKLCIFSHGWVDAAPFKTATPFTGLHEGISASPTGFFFLVILLRDINPSPMA